MLRLKRQYPIKQLAIMIFMNLIGTALVGLCLLFGLSFVEMSYAQSMNLALFLIILGIPILIAIFGALWTLEAFLLHLHDDDVPYRVSVHGIIVVILLAPFSLFLFAINTFFVSLLMSAIIFLWGAFVVFLIRDKKRKNHAL